MQPTDEITAGLRGLWRVVSSRNSGECYGVEIEPDPVRGAGLFASLLIWNPGRTGCDTCSSDIVRLPLTMRPGQDQLVLTGDIPMTKTKARTLELAVSQPADRRAGAQLRDRGAVASVTLEATDVLPVFDL